MQLYPIPSIVGDGAAHKISQTSKMVRQIILTAVGGPAYIGDSTVSATKGAELPSGIPVQIYADQDDMTNRFDLSAQYVFVPNSTTLTISYAV